MKILKLIGVFSFLVLVCASGALGQNVNVSGALVGNGSYPDLGSAFTAINGGAQTGATISVSIVGNTTEAASAVLNQGTWTTLTISPSGGALRTVSGMLAAPLIDLNGADNININGLNTGGNALTFSNSDTGSLSTSTVRFINDAVGNTITNTTILGSSTSSTLGTVVFSTASSGGNDNNTISNCTIDASGTNLPTNAIYSDGTTGQENSGNTISSNNIANFFNASFISRGIFINTASTDWTISGNRLYQSATRTYTTGNTHRAIQIASGNNHILTSNIIGFANSAGTGVYAMTGTIATRFIGIDLSVGTTTATSVQGNTVTAITLGTSSGAATLNGVICGINITGGNVNVGTIAGNTIGAATGINAIVATPTTTQGAVVGINSSSTGTISIQNNIIGALSSSGITAAVAGGISGINVSGVAASMTISGNTIGNATAENMRGGTLGITTGSSPVSGINLTALPATSNINNNTIQNLSSYGAGTTGFVRGIWTFGATGNPSTYSITSNTIRNLTTNAANSSISNGQASAVGINPAVGTNGVISQNTIHTIANISTASTASFVAGITLANATNTTATRNLIYDITNAGTSVSATAPSIAAGMIIRSGTTAVNINNNMISLGTGQTTNTAFLGIQANHGSTPDPVNNIYFNTINITGTAASGAQPSFGIARTDFSVTARTPTMNVRNNLITNTRSGGTGGHYAIANNFGATPTATGWGANFSNSNVLNANAATVGWWGGNQTFAGWQTASAGDSASFSGITVNYVNPANDLHLNMGVTPTVLESNGQTIAGISNDFDNQTRPGPTGSVNGGAFAPDIGADEFDGVYIDVLPPSITYTSLSFTCATGDRTISANIIDFTGVPTSGALQPRIYFRKNAGSYVSAQGTLTSGTATNGTWDFTISTAAMGGIAQGDTVSYFIIAQDTISPTPNVSSNPSAGLVALNVNTVTTPPTTPNSYTIGATLNGTYTVGATGDYPTLTAAANAYNTSCLTGAVVFSLIDATYPSETFPIAFNANPFSSAANSLTIKPATGVTSTISGSSATSIININGGDFITIDGSNGNTPNTIVPRISASRDLTISNTNTSTASGVIWLSTNGTGDAVTNSTVQNTIISGNAPLTTGVALGSGGPTLGSGAGSNGNTNIGFINNDIRNCQIGIFVAGASTSAMTQNATINQNVINTGVGRGGISLIFVNNATVSANTVGNILNTASTDVFGINAGFSGAGTYSVTDAGVTDGVLNAVITKNNISGVAQTGTFSAVGIGLANSTSGTSLIANNMISGVIANGTSGDFAGGIVLGGGTGGINVFHNSVSMDGAIAAGGSQMTTALGITSATAPTSLDIRNNIFSNTQTTPSAMRLTAIAYRYVSPYTGIVSNYNDLYSTGSGGLGTYAVGTTGGLVGGTLRTTLGDWQTETGGDANSVSVAPVFVSPTDLHLTINNPLLITAGTAVSTTDDFDNDPRNTAPDIGADELVQAEAGNFPSGTFYNAIGENNDTFSGNVTITNNLTLEGLLLTGANTLTIDCNATISGVENTKYIIGNVRKSFCAAGNFTFPVGTTPDNMLTGIPMPEYSPLTANVTAGTFPSSLTVTVTDGFLAGSGVMTSASRFWDVTENGDLTADLTFNYLDQDVNGTEAMYQVLRRSAGTTAVYPGGTVDAMANTGTATGVTEFSGWTAGQLAPVAASADIGGRIKAADGRGIRNAVIVLSGGSLSQPVYARSSSFGYFRFEGLTVGETYVLTVNSKRFTFTNPSRVITLNDNVTDADFTAEP